MRTVLVPTAPHDVMDATLQTAIALARRFGGYLEGFALRPPLAEIVSVDMVMGLTWAADERADAEAEAQARDTFQGFMDAAGIARDAGPAEGAGNGSSTDRSWRTSRMFAPRSAMIPEISCIFPGLSSIRTRRMPATSIQVT